MSLNRRGFYSKIAKWQCGSQKKQESGSTLELGKRFKPYTKVPRSEWKWPDILPYTIACKGTQELLINEHALDCLSALHKEIGVLHITSGYRSVEHNKKVGGARGSYHTKGMAFDLAVVGPRNAERIIAAAKRCGFKGIGTYPERSFVHIDTGPPRRWGKPFPSAQALENNTAAKPLAQSRTISAGRKAGFVLVFDLIAKVVTLPTPVWLHTAIGLALGALTLGLIGQMIYYRVLEWQEDF